MSLFAWVHAWEAAMAESGYPRARLDPGQWEGEWSYSWLSDLDAFVAGVEQDELAWDIAHVAFLLVDRLRPEWMPPSIILGQMIRERDQMLGERDASPG